MNLETHLNELPAAEAAAYRALAARLRGLPAREPSAGLEAGILAAVEREARRRPPVRTPPWWGFAAAAALVAALSLWRVYRPAAGACGLAAPAGGAGLAWLAASQEPDGSWNPARHGGAEAFRPALTALAALALLREPDRYAGPLDRAGAALAARQRPDGSFGGADRAGAYNQAMATCALAALCRERPALRPALSRALSGIGARQTPQGGWDYEPAAEGNAALTAWQVRALADAEALGFEEARVPLRKGLRWLRGNARDDGTVAYRPASFARSESLTALAAHALLTAGRDFDGLPELGRRAARTLEAEPAGPAAADAYRDYAKVLALESAGEAERAESVRRRMAARQAEAADDQWAAVGGRLYATALTALASR